MQKKHHGKQCFSYDLLMISYDFLRKIGNQRVVVVLVYDTDGQKGPDIKLKRVTSVENRNCEYGA